MAMPIRQWVTLNDITIPIATIESIELIIELGEYFYIVRCNNQKIHKVHLESTGGKWLYMVCHDGLTEAQRGGERYERL